MADQDIKMLIERIMAEARTHQSTRFSNEIYADEPILKTGRQMQNFLPDQYRKMREISRWQDDPKGGAGRWLSEAELFYRQGLLMADFEDDCPYNGTFKSYFPTYNAMSDRQLRGYFTWRAQVRRGTVEETSTSFAFLYLYELICGIGVDNPLDGFNKIKAFWDAYRAFEPGIDRFARVWLQDYAVFHGLDPSCFVILKPSCSITPLSSCGARHETLYRHRHRPTRPPNVAKPPSPRSPFRPMRCARSDSWPPSTPSPRTT